MTATRTPRSLLATLVGYVLVAIIAWVLLRFVLGTIFWLIRTVIVILVIGGLLALYLSLKTPKD